MENAGMANTSWMDGDYDNQYWPMLRDTIDTVMLKPQGSYNPFSYEQMYSAVYKCVCKHQAERLHADLMNHVEVIIKKWSESLFAQLRSNDPIGYISQFHDIIVQFFSALSSIVPIFIYLNRFYVESRLGTNLITQFHQLFVRHLTDLHIGDLLGCLGSMPPMSVSPAKVQTILKHLNSLNSQYCQLDIVLFSKHVTGILAPMAEDELQRQIESDRILQQQLRQEGFGQGNQRLKRSNSDLECNQVSTKS